MITGGGVRGSATTALTATPQLELSYFALHNRTSEPFANKFVMVDYETKMNQ